MGRSSRSFEGINYAYLFSHFFLLERRWPPPFRHFSFKIGCFEFARVRGVRRSKLNYMKSYVARKKLRWTVHPSPHLCFLEPFHQWSPH